MKKEKLTTALLISLVLFCSLAMFKIETAFADYYTEVQTVTFEGTGAKAKMGTTTQYGYIGPSGERHPRFYSALIAKVQGEDLSVPFIYKQRIEISGKDPNGNPLPSDRFCSPSVLSSPDGSDVEQEILKIIFGTLLSAVPYGLGEPVKYTISDGGAIYDWTDEYAYAEWTSPIAPISGERGLRYGFTLEVYTTLEGTYTINIHYRTSITVKVNPRYAYGHNLDIYDTVQYTYVNTPLAPPTPSGPASGYRGTSYSYTTSTTDPNGDSLKYEFDWGDGTTYTTDWYTSGATASASHSWGSLGTYYVKVRAYDATGAWSSWSPSLTVNIVDRAPNTPSAPSGPTSGYAGTSYSYSTSTTDLDGDYVHYQFNWGDGTTTTTSSYSSGTTVSASHTWSSLGTYYVKVRAQDSYSAWSGWSSSLTVTITERREACPYVYTWDGQQYVMDNNLLPTSLKSNGTDVEDCYRLEQTLVPKYESTLFSLYSLRVGEFENEHSYIDQVRLLAVDYSAGFNIAVTPDGEIVTYQQPQPPLSCIDNNGKNRLSEVLFMDGNVSNTVTYFYGERGDYLILDFGIVDAENAKLILRSDMKCENIDWGCCIEVQVLNNGEWQKAALVAPREYWAIEAVNLSPYVTKGQNLTVRLYWTMPHRLDYVGLDTTPQDSFELHYATLISAIHSSEGNVRQRLLGNDQTYAELTPGQQIQLTFLLSNNQNQKRTFILYTEGHYNTIAP